MEASFFIPIENQQQDDFNDLPDAYQRRGNPFWDFTRSLLNLAQERFPIDRDGVNEAIATIREYERRRQPPVVTLGDIVADVVDEVREAVKETVAKVKKQTAIAHAVEWLKQALNAGPQPQKVVEAMAQNEGISARTLKRAKAKARVVSERKGRDYWIWRLGVVKSKDGQER